MVGPKGSALLDELRNPATTDERFKEILEGHSITVEFEVGGVPSTPTIHRVETVRNVEFAPKSGRGVNFWDPDKKLRSIALSDITRIR